MILLKDFLLFAYALVGLASPWFVQLRNRPPTSAVSIAIGAALISGYLIVFSIYVLGAKLAYFWITPALGIIMSAGLLRAKGYSYSGIALPWKVIGHWFLLTTWCLGWHSVVTSYSGGTWSADWWEHYERAHFFLARWPVDVVFLDTYLMPARPPLVNLWAAALMSGGGGGFAHYQIFMTLLGSLAYFPLAALVRHWGGRSRAQSTLLVALMCNPMFVQNSVFPWTKLPAAFFIILSLSLTMTLTKRRETTPQIILIGTMLAGGMLSHYSIGPWAFAIAAGCLIIRETRDLLLKSRFALAMAMLASAAIVLPWIAWSLYHYGASTTFAHNTSIALAPDGSPIERAARAMINLLHTASPIPIVGMKHPLLIQENPLGTFRDWWFIRYQMTLPWSLGSAGMALFVIISIRTRAYITRSFLAWTAAIVVFLSAIVHAQPSSLGTSHIVLQPLAFTCIAWLAAWISRRSTCLSVIWLLGLKLDLILGIVLHFWIQSQGATTPSSAPFSQEHYTSSLTPTAIGNYEIKSVHGFMFLGDSNAPVLATALIAVPFACALYLNIRNR